MTDPTKRTRSNELTYSAAVERLRDLEVLFHAESHDAATDAAARAAKKVCHKYLAKQRAVFARLPGKLHAAAAEEAGVPMPPDEQLAHASNVGASYGRELSEEDAVPARLMEPLSAERIAVGRGR